MLLFSLQDVQAMKANPVLKLTGSVVSSKSDVKQNPADAHLLWTLTLNTRPILEPVDESQPRPGLIHGTDLIVHQACRQTDFAHPILGQIRGDSRGFLRPGDPETAGRAEASSQSLESSNQVSPVTSKEYHYVESRPAAILMQANAIGKPAQAFYESFGTFEHSHSAILFDP
jgi:hypothetical protein